MAHCGRCYYALSADVRASLYRRMGEGYEEAYARSVEMLRDKGFVPREDAKREETDHA
jgi:hypothetical protein